MRICYFAHTGPLFHELASAMVREGHEISFICFRDMSVHPVLDPRRWEDITVYTVDGRLKWDAVAVMQRIRLILRQVQPEVLHSHYVFPYGLYGGLSFWPRLILSLHGSDAYYGAWKLSSLTTQRLEQSGLGKPLFHMAHRFLAFRARRVVVGSPDLAEVAVRLGYRKERIRRCDIGVDTTIFHLGRKDESLRQELLHPFREGYVVLCTRAFKPVYGHLELLRAFRLVVDRLPNAVLVLTSAGFDEERIRREIESLGLMRNVKIVGIVPHAELARYMCSSDLLCSVARSDTTSLSVLEGMACGLPILASRVGSIPARLGVTRGGVLVEPGDLDAIARGLFTLLTKPELREELGRRNAEYVARSLTFKDTVHKHLAVYRELVSPAA